MTGDRIPRPYLMGWLALIGLGLGCALAIDATPIYLIFHPPANAYWAPDFTVFWVGPKVPLADLYDVGAMTRAQSEFTSGSTSPRPWIYPPTFLLWIAPFHRLPFWVAFWAWNLVGAATLMTAAWRLIGRRALFLPLSVPIIFSIIAGQTSLLLGGLVGWGIALLGTRPRLAGILFGLAATIKPQAVLLAPLALLVSRDFVALGWSLCVGAVVGLVAVLFLGVQPWLDWMEAITGFLTIVNDMELMSRSVTPTGMVEATGLRGSLAVATVVTGIGLGVALVWRGFRSKEPIERLAALAVGSLLCSPYAMGYEPAAAAIAATGILFDPHSHPVRWLGAAFLFACLGWWLAPLFFAVALLFPARRAGPAEVYVSA